MCLDLKAVNAHHKKLQNMQPGDLSSMYMRIDLEQKAETHTPDMTSTELDLDMLLPVKQPGERRDQRDPTCWRGLFDCCRGSRNDDGR